MRNYRLTILLFLLSLALGSVSAQKPWVRCTSRPYDIERGLDGRHISLWASHGRYYDNAEGKWQWQRPPLFGTCEDLFTQTIVVPYLIPMLENAGAVVFTPRERDWQRNEVIVDNNNITQSHLSSHDSHLSPLITYQEQGIRHPWTDAPFRGFGLHNGNYRHGENPFEAGTARQCEATHSKSRLSTISYQPLIPEAGRYAVYVSYQTVDESIDDAHYTVWHKGQSTEFCVNQQMGGGTWVYLGTFDFDEGCSEQNRVVLSNLSECKGVVTADAVRFGGGMGNIERGGRTSGMPRCLEGARYYAQWAGMPPSVYSSKDGQNDYADDINVRSLMTNLLCGGSALAPDSAGRHVPIELSLAIHSDAGHTDTGLGVYGSLAICTTQKGDSLLGNGRSRQLSYQLASSLLDNVTKDMQYRYGQWEARALYDRNYSETRLPVVPSAILETLSHQNFGDMLFAQDPTFRFYMARSIYKTILRFLNDEQTAANGAGTSSERVSNPVVQPLPPEQFHIEFTKKQGEVKLSWQGIIDSQEPTAAPTGYVLYMAVDNGGYDNGTQLRGSSCNIRLMPNVLYKFRITATNDGGESFPTEELTALYNPAAKKTVLVVNAFDRLSSPAISGHGQGFDLQQDAGVTYGRTAGWLGLQRVFDESKIGIVDSIGLGFTTNDYEGRFIAGNTFDYVATHAEAIRKAGNYSIVSASAKALEDEELDLTNIAAIDLILGLQRPVPQLSTTFAATVPSTTGAYVTPNASATESYVPTLPLYASTPLPLSSLTSYVQNGGRLMVSGAYVASAMTTGSERAFLSDVLKTRLDGVNREYSSQIQGLGMNFNIYRQLNEEHYAAVETDVIMPVNDAAFPAMLYANQSSAAVAWQGEDARTFTMAFPFECINDAETRTKIMYGILKFLISSK